MKLANLFLTTTAMAAFFWSGGFSGGEPENPIWSGPFYIEPDRVYFAPATGRFTLEWTDIDGEGETLYEHVVERSTDLKSWECVGGHAIRYDLEIGKFVFSEQEGDLPRAYYRIYAIAYSDY